jgi:uncharacterized protein (TIGR02145 family)
MRFFRYLILISFICLSFIARTQLFGGQIKSKPGIISLLNCSNAIVSGTIYSGVNITNVNVSIPYTGGNMGVYPSSTFTSSGVTGLFASCASGQLSQGSGNVYLTIFGTASTTGTAYFNILFCGQSCQLNLLISSLSSLYLSNSVFCASGPTLILDVTNPITGKTWMDRNLGASQVATSPTDTNAYGDLYQWGRGADGHQCRTSPTTSTLSSTDQPGHGNFILAPNTPNDWRSPQNANLWQGVNGVNNPCPSGYRVPTETEINAERLSWGSSNSLGAFASQLKLPVAGRRWSNNGSLEYVGSFGTYWSSTVSSTNSKSLFFSDSSYVGGSSSITNYARWVGRSVRCIKETVGFIGSLNCAGHSQTGNLIMSQAASGVSISIPYIGGNGGFYASQTISSTGVTGLTASISQNWFASGAGSLIFNISGTPISSGTATFVIDIGGQSCSVNILVYGTQPQYPTGSVFCASGPTLILDVTNPITGKTWMDRNLGASQVATSPTDTNAYGDLYQWGRGTDGHQCRTSPTTSTLSSTDQPGHGNFILVTWSGNQGPDDWRTPQNITLWDGVNGVNNPCPNGYRIPTAAEFNAERLSWSSPNSIGAFNSPLKFSLAGFRNYTGTIGHNGFTGQYWSNTSGWTNQGIGYYLSTRLYFGQDFAVNGQSHRSKAMSVRCIKD